MSLPVEYRWEFTRRHPYYLSYWKAAAKYRTNPSDDPAHRLFEQIAVQILGGIGIARSEQPIDPKLGAEALVLCPA